MRNLKISSQKLPYHEASNGQAEQAVRAFKEGMEKMEEGTMQDKLSRFLPKYRTTPHTTTGVTPAELLMKRKLRTKLDLIVPNTASLVGQMQEHQEQTYNHDAKQRVFGDNDPVFIKDFSSPKSWQKGTVVQTTGPVSAPVELLGSRVVQQHQDHIWSSHSQEPTKSNPETLVPGVVPEVFAQQTQPNRVGQPSQSWVQLMHKRLNHPAQFATDVYPNVKWIMNFKTYVTSLLNID